MRESFATSGEFGRYGKLVATSGNGSSNIPLVEMTSWTEDSPTQYFCSILSESMWSVLSVYQICWTFTFLRRFLLPHLAELYYKFVRKSFPSVTFIWVITLLSNSGMQYWNFTFLIGFNLYSNFGRKTFLHFCWKVVPQLDGEARSFLSTPADISAPLYWI